MIDFTKLLDECHDNVLVSNDLENELSKLTIGNDDSEFSYNDFCKKLNKLLCIQYQMILKEIDIEDTRVDTIKQCLAWAYKLWIDSINQDDLDKILLSYCILDYFFIPASKLPIRQINESIMISIRDILLNNIISQTCLKYHNNKKDVEYYKGALRNKNSKEILKFIEIFEYRSRYYTVNPFYEKLFKLVYTIDPTLFFEIINRSEPIVSAYVINFFTDELFDILNNSLLVNEIFKIKGFIELVSLNESNFDINMIKNISPLFTILLNLKSINHSIKELFDLARMRDNRLFHSLCGYLISNDKSYIKEYIDTINFGYDHNNIGKSFIDTLIANSIPEDYLEVLKQLKEKYYEYLLSNNYSHFPINHYTSFITSIFIILESEVGSDPKTYIKLLLERIKEIKVIRSSWNWECIRFYYQKFLYLIYYNVIAKIDLQEFLNEIDIIENFISDERDEYLWKDIDLNEIISILKSPNLHKEIKLSQNGSIYTVKFNTLNADENR